MKFKLFSNNDPVAIEKEVNEWIISNNPQQILFSSVSTSSVTIKSNSTANSKKASQEIPLVMVGVWYK